MTQVRIKFIEAIQGLNLQDSRLQNGDTLLTALGKLQGQLDSGVDVYIQPDLPKSHGPYVWYQTFKGSQTVKEWIHDGVSDLLGVGSGAVLSVGDGFVLRVS